MFKRVSFALVALALVGFAAGCSEAPVAQFDASKSVLESARVAEAEQYAPGLYKQASDSLNAATVEIQKQDDKFSVLRDYDRAQEIIAAAQKLAEQAVSEAAIEKERIRVLDSAMIVEIETLIGETNTALAKAPRGKGTAADLKVMKADVEAAGNALAAAVADYNAGSYLTAQSKLQAVKTQVVNVKSQVDAAISKLKK